MKYIAPKYEIALVETEDILTASSGQAANYEIEEKDDGSGKILIDMGKLFFQLNNRKAVRSKIYTAF